MCVLLCTISDDPLPNESAIQEFKILMDKLQFATAEYSYDISQHE